MAAVTAILSVLATPLMARAQNYEVGLVAYGAGDFQSAHENWLPIAQQGDADAQFNLGTMYEDGKWVTPNHAEAARWYHLAAAQGDAPAQFNLGVMYAAGMGVSQNFAAAHMWYSISEENGAESGRLGRERLELNMTSTDISEALRRARVCKVSNYSDCN